MRCYTDIETRAIAEQQVLSVRLEPSIHSKVSASVSPISDRGMDEFSFSTHVEMPETIQFIADLEFGTKFAALLHSIAGRCPAFCWPTF
jgi:hypothetical protein